MSDRNPAEIRLELARGHWSLDEHDEAIECLLRIVADAPATAGLAEMLAKCAIESEDPRLSEAQETLAGSRAKHATDTKGDASPLHTATMAQLLADQGHESKALQVATEVLDRNPEDERARELRQRLELRTEERGRRVEALERWLARIRERGHRGVRA